MAIEVVEDLVDGSSFTQTPKGFSAIRTFLISGMTGSPSAKLYDALNVGGIPKSGEPHPSVGAINVLSANATSEDQQAETIKVVCTYGIDEPGSGGGSGDDPIVIEIGSTTVESVTYQDAADDGILLFNKYTKKNGQDADPQITQGINVQIPMTTIRVHRKEPTINVETKQDIYVGRVNSGSHKFIEEGKDYEDRTLLCTRIDGTTADGGENMNVTYEFTYRPSGWFVTDEWKDPATQNVPTRATRQDYSRTATTPFGGAWKIPWYTQINFDPIFK